MAVSDYSESIGAGGEVRSEVVSQGTRKDASMSSLERQPSVFALTLDEIQTRSGMSFGSMNMDELLNTVSSDDFQVSSTVDHQPPNDHENGASQRSFSVPTPLSGKTVDEVWAEIQGNTQAQHNQGRLDFPRFITTSEFAQLQTLGEMTLEDFLIAAGVIRPPSPPLPMQQDQRIDLNDNPSPGSYFSNGSCLNTGMTIGQQMAYDFSTRASGVNGNGLNTLMSDGSSAFNMFSVAGIGGGCIGEPSSMVKNGKFNINSSANTGETGYTKRKQYPTIDVAVERRVRRMIKNRESAARSRARKQAYTAELEKEMAEHRAKNSALKLALEAAEKKLKELGGGKEVETKGSVGPLRRTKSATF